MKYRETEGSNVTKLWNKDNPNRYAAAVLAAYNNWEIDVCCVALRSNMQMKNVVNI